MTKKGTEGSVLKYLLLVVLLAAAVFTAMVLPRAVMAGEGEEAPPPASQQPSDIDDNDDTRVEVQLVVLGIAAASVVGAGLVAYFVRRRLGLTAYDPAAHTGGAHH
jgi:hypothetical protein